MSRTAVSCSVFTILAGGLLISDESRASSFADVTEGRIVFEGTAELLTQDGVSSFSGILGTGSFRYSPTPFEGTIESVFAMTPPPPPADTLTIGADQNLRTVADINISVLGTEWNKGWYGQGSGTSSFAVEYFWEVPAVAVGEFPGPNSGGPFIVIDSSDAFEGDVRLDDGWRFGNSRAANLNMTSDGHWELEDPYANQPLHASGTYRVSAVPEPLTVLGTVVAVLFGIVFRFLSKTKQPIAQ